MARYIDADKLSEEIKHLYWVNKECEKDAIYTIKHQPTADVVAKADVMKVCEKYSKKCLDSNDTSGQLIADCIEIEIVGLPTTGMDGKEVNQ